METNRSSHSEHADRVGPAVLLDKFYPLRSRPKKLDRKAPIVSDTRSEPADNTAENLILRAMPRRDYLDIEPYLTLVELTKRQFLHNGSETLGFIYFPITAIVSDYSILKDGRMVEIAVTGREGAVGLASFLLESDSTADITQVSQAGTAMRIDAKSLAMLMRSHEVWRTDLNRSIGSYISQISQRAICNMFHSVEERLCTWMLMVRDRCGEKILDLTHEDLAQILGVFRPTVTSVAHEMRRKELINYARGVISIRDRSRVEKAACTCYSTPEWVTK